MIFLCRADEHDATISHLLCPRDPPDYNGLAIKALAGKRRIESRAKGILAEHTDWEGVILRCRDIRGPLHKPAEIIKIGGLHLILSHFWLLTQHGGNV